MRAYMYVCMPARMLNQHRTVTFTGSRQVEEHEGGVGQQHSDGGQDVLQSQWLRSHLVLSALALVHLLLLLGTVSLRS